jgi:hypothetical protein
MSIRIRIFCALKINKESKLVGFNVFFPSETLYVNNTVNIQRKGALSALVSQEFLNLKRRIISVSDL